MEDTLSEDVQIHYKKEWAELDVVEIHYRTEGQVAEIQ